MQLRRFAQGLTTTEQVVAAVIPTVATAGRPAVSVLRGVAELSDLSRPADGIRVPGLVPFHDASRMLKALRSIVR